MISGLSKNARGDHFSFSPQEDDVMRTIRLVLDWSQRDTVVRVAGGWVRDKLLGKSSHDLDLVVDDLSGVEFAELVNTYLHEVKREHVSRIGVIERRPEQSKHLETASFRVHDQEGKLNMKNLLSLAVLSFSEVDVNQLRSESYADHSRIPVVDAGTPLEDAKRRDLTINSLFYNVNTDEIEDFDGRVSSFAPLKPL